jgi:hypothetical protein
VNSTDVPEQIAPEGFWLTVTVCACACAMNSREAKSRIIYFIAQLLILIPLF